jgi:N-acetyl-gamma-glutamyl-phosphate reductase
MTRVHVWGAGGYAAAEAIAWIEGHPRLEAGVLESRTHAGTCVADTFARLRRSTLHFAASGAVLAQLAPGDIVITAGASGEARAQVGKFLAQGARVVDLSVDYRFDPLAVYGLPEYHRATIAGTRLVANPGCYPTASLLALLPLVRVATPLGIAIDAKSGITGAGRTPQLAALFAEVSGDIRAYALQGHRHEPEIAQELRRRGLELPITFTPHVVPLARGMLVDVYAFYACPPDPEAIAAAYDAAYRDEPFVRVLTNERVPSVAAVVGTNDAEIRVDVRGAMVRVICAIDNLGKGAAAQAIQNVNIMLGYPEEEGLHARTALA